jgi:anaerobic ribonucleoside-triphosphate reductase
MQSTNGDYYFRLDNCSRIINLAGLREAAEAFYEKSIAESEKIPELMDEINQDAEIFIQRTSRRRGRRLSVAMLPDIEAAERLVRLDIEKYGIGKVKFSGTREKPFYSTVTRLIAEDGKILPESLKSGQNIRLLNGGNPTVVELGESETKTDELLEMTRQLFEKHNAEFLTYNRKLTFCVNCKRSWIGLLHKCPLCGSVGTLTVFDRYATA